MTEPAEPNAGGPEPDANDLFGSNGLLARTEAKLSREVAARPDEPKTLWQLATIQRRRGNVAAALETCRRIETLLPDHPRVCWTIAVLSGADLQRMQTPTGHASAPFERLRDFLTPEECDALLRLAMGTRDQFVPARVGGDDSTKETLRPDIRQALVAKEEDLQDGLSWFKAKLVSAAEKALRRLPVRDLETHEIELQLTVHRDGGFYRVHKDASDGSTRSDRRLSYVYYFHHQPRRFSGGDLLLYDTDRPGNSFELGVFTRIEPLHNSIVFFPSDCYHEITPIRTGESLADARFTVNGWINKPRDVAPA